MGILFSRPGPGREVVRWVNVLAAGEEVHDLTSQYDTDMQKSQDHMKHFRPESAGQEKTRND